MAPQGVEPIENFLSLFHTRPYGQLQRHAYARIVLRGEELGAHKAHEEEGADKDAQADYHRYRAVRHHAVKQSGIAVV